MTRPKSIHRCQACGHGSSRWSGRCSACGEWNTLVEELVLPFASGAASGRAADPQLSCALGHDATPLPLRSISAEGAVAVATGIGELDRVLGGGLVAGSVTVLGGEPGVGKSTLVLQALASLAAQGRTSLLIAAEESGEQVRRRADRLRAAVDGCYLLATTDLDVVIGAAGQLEPSVLVVDSIQAVSDSACGSQAGSPSQVRECAGRLVRYAKSVGVATLLVGHVTKDGGLAGPRTLEHLVDTVLSFDGDRHQSLRLLAASKHRYGPTGELGLFEMTEIGLRDVADPSALLLGDRRPRHAGEHRSACTRGAEAAHSRGPGACRAADVRNREEGCTRCRRRSTRSSAGRARKEVPPGPRRLGRVRLHRWGSPGERARR